MNKSVDYFPFLFAFLLYLYIMFKSQRAISSISLSLIFIGLFSVGISLKPKHTPQIFGENPGYFEQWFNERKNANGVIPSWLKSTWNKWDHSQISNRANGNPIDNITEIGPNNVGGRTRALWVDPTNDNLILAGGISGGMWRSENGGKTWKALNEQEITLQPSCITSNPFNNNEIYYGTGECRYGGLHNEGNGVFKSSDRGKTFQQLTATATLGGFDAIWDIEHSNSDSNTIFVGTNTAGMFRSTNKGASWSAVYTAGNKQVNDILCLPSGRVLISQQSNNVYYSDSNGKAGTFIPVSFPSKPVAGTYRLIKMANSRKYPNVIYALFEGWDYESGPAAFYKSSDGGKTWKLKTTPTSINTGQQAYCVAIGVSAVDSNKIFAGCQYAASSINGGTSWSSLKSSHADNHSFAAFSTASNEYITGTDGGIYRFKWNSQTALGNANTGYNVTQFYAGSYDLTGIRAVGGTQDNGTQFSTGPLITSRIFGGDGAYCHIGQQDGDVAYVSYQNEGIHRLDNFSTLGSANSTSITDSRFTTEGISFINPYTMNPADQYMLFYKTNSGVYRTINGGDIWEKINKISRSSIKALACSEDADPVFYYGGAAAQLYKLEKARSAIGTEVSFNSSVPSSVTSDFINGITINPVNKYQIFVAFTTVSNQGRVWKASNLETTTPVWENISGNLPPGLPVNMVAVDPQDPENKIFAATDYGFYFTVDGGKTWTKDTRIPNVEVHEIKMRNSDRTLFLYTHGRGMWAIKLAPLSSTQKIEKLKLVSLYPNPASKYLTVKLNIQTTIQAINVYDLNGKICKNVNRIEDNKIDVCDLAEGVYFVQVVTPEKSFTQKIKIER